MMQWGGGDAASGTPSTPGGTNQNGGGAGDAFKMDTNQKKAYETAITSVVTAAANGDIPANMVAQQLKAINQGLAPLNFKVVDTKAGQPIAKGTKADALKARFKAQAK